MAEDDTTASETYELHGPKNYSMAEIAELVDKEIVKRRRHINVPARALKRLADMYNRLIWWSETSSDSVTREFIDQTIDPKAKTFKDLGIEPGALANLTFQYLVSSLVMFQYFSLTDRAARIPERRLLRPTASHGARKTRREEICAYYR